MEPDRFTQFRDDTMRIPEGYSAPLVIETTREIIGRRTRDMAMPAPGYTNTADVKPANPNCFATIENAWRMSDSMASRVAEIVDRLAGGVPREAVQPPPPIGNGLMSAAMEQGAGIYAAMERIRKDLDRLEKALP